MDILRCGKLENASKRRLGILVLECVATIGSATWMLYAYFFHLQFMLELPRHIYLIVPLALFLLLRELVVLHWVFREISMRKNLM